MRKALILILTAFLIVSLFIACKNEPEPIPEITITFDGNGSRAGEMDSVTVHKGEAAERPFEFTRLRNGQRYGAGRLRNNTLGSYLHLHFAGCPEQARAFVEACAAWKERH